MKPALQKSALSLALAASLLGGTTWSTASHACAAEPLVSSVCIMAATKTNLSGFHLADGSMQQIAQNQVLYSLIGQTYGGSGNTGFALPDLRGRVVVGAGTSASLDLNVPYSALGTKGGAASIALNTSQLPLHVHTLNGSSKAPGVMVNAGIGSLKVAMSGLTATTTLGTLAANTALTGVTASASASGLTLNASSNATLVNSPANALLGTTTLTTAKIYSSSGPLVAMQAGSITGTLPVTFAGASPTKSDSMSFVWPLIYSAPSM